jgi:hypothetical protein
VEDKKDGKRSRRKMVKSRLRLLLLPFDLIIDRVTGFYVRYRVRSIKRLVLKLGIGSVSLALIMFIMRTRE